MQILSSAFKHGETIPEQYTCRGQNINPQLIFVDVPTGTKSLALILHDPDALNGDFVHWLIWDIPISANSIASSNLPVGAVQGQNGVGSNKYIGPCPPAGSGTHRYMFELYALNFSLNLKPDTNRQKLEEAMKGHVIEQATLTGLVAAQN